MSWFTGKQHSHKRGRKSSRIDPSTGRNKRDKSPLRTRDTGSRGGGVPRQIGTGKAVSRAQWRRDKKTRRRLRSRNYPETNQGQGTA